MLFVKSNALIPLGNQLHQVYMVFKLAGRWGESKL